MDLRSIESNFLYIGSKLPALSVLHDGVKRMRANAQQCAVNGEGGIGLIVERFQRAARAVKRDPADVSRCRGDLNGVIAGNGISRVQCSKIQGRIQRRVLNANRQSNSHLRADMAAFVSNGGEFVKTVGQGGGVEWEGHVQFRRARGDVNVIARLKIG